MYYGKVEISGINTSKLKVLTEAEKSVLLEKTAHGDMKAREELINGNLRLVLSVIQKFTGRSESPDDLFQVGVIGLIKAIDNFSAEFGVKFSTYAVPIAYSSRNTCKKGSQTMTIKRQKAFDIAISAIKALPECEENLAAIEYLESARNERYIKWSKEKIFEAMNTWRKEHSRSPTIKDLGDTSLPSAGTIRSVFGMTVSVFFDIYYPTEPARCFHKYGNKTADEWVADFIEQYETLLPSSAEDYDLRRRAGTPAWITVARYAKLSTWYELISFTGVSQHCLKRKYRLKSEPREWTVRSTSHFLEEYARLKEHIDEVFRLNLKK